MAGVVALILLIMIASSWPNAASSRSEEADTRERMAEAGLKSDEAQAYLRAEIDGAKIKGIKSLAFAQNTVNQNVNSLISGLDPAEATKLKNWFLAGHGSGLIP